jgi:large subunit ribosomal protein L10
MLLTKQKKEQKLEELKDLFSSSAACVAIDYSGLKANDLTEIRKDLKLKGIPAIVTKNSLVAKALESVNMEMDKSILDRPIMFSFAQDEVEISKILFAFAKTHEKLEVLGGLVRGESADKAKIKLLSTLPGREELQARLVGAIASPIHGFVNVLAGNMRGLVSVLNQYKEKI